MEIQDEYKNKFEIYQRFKGDLLEDLSNKTLVYERLNIQLLTGRLKDPTSLRLKIDSSPKYKSLSDVTDVLGLRIVTSYLNEIPFIEAKLREGFEIDEANTNTNEAKSESEFGYSSSHIIIYNAKDPSFKTYNPKYKGLKAEIQIRTILQHAWAEISHKIEYKAKQKPESLQRRKLFRIAALLELADQEFSVIREEIVKSQKLIIPRDVIKFIDQPIDIETLQAFVMESDSCNALDQKIANLTDSVLHYNEESISEKNLNQIKKLNIKTLKDLNAKLKGLSNEIVSTFEKENKSWIQFRKAFPETHGNSSAPRGISITYLFFYLTGKYD